MQYSRGGSPRRSATQVLRQQLALAHGVLGVRHAVKPPTPPPVRSGTAATSPAPQASSTIPSSPCRRAGRRAPAAGRAPRSAGRCVRTIGLAMTPAVQMMRSASNVSPVDSLHDAADPRGQLRVEVHLRRRAAVEVLDHPVAGLERHLGHDPAHASIRWKCMSSNVELRVAAQQRASRASAARRRSRCRRSRRRRPRRSAAGRARARRAGSAALSKLVSRRSRIATASSMVFRPIAWSATPGIGKVRDDGAGGRRRRCRTSSSHGSPIGRRDRRAPCAAWSIVGDLRRDDRRSA